MPTSYSKSRLYRNRFWCRRHRRGSLARRLLATRLEHDLNIGRVYFWTVEEDGQGSGADARFGGPFARDEAVAEFRAQMARRQDG